MTDEIELLLTGVHEPEVCFALMVSWEAEKDGSLVLHNRQTWMTLSEERVLLSVSELYI